jgi:NADPH-dependent glutamate synthase beta subunit-like oxidoreductase
MLGAPIACAVNPEVGKEAECTSEPAKKPKKVFVIGGGPAGMEAAAGAARRGRPRRGLQDGVTRSPSLKREIGWEETFSWQRFRHINGSLAI